MDATAGPTCPSVADMTMSRSSGRRAARTSAVSEREVGVERSFVKLVEDDGGDPLQPGVGLQASREDTLGDHLDARRGGDFGIETNAVSDRLTDGFAEDGGHAVRRRARGESAGFQKEDGTVAEPRGAGKEHGEG